MAYTHIKPGEELEISTHIYHGEDEAHVAELVALPVEELKRLEQESVEKENAIFQSMCDLLPVWKQQAGKTIYIREAMEYLKTGPVEHSSNQWRMFDTFRHEMSNMVYKMVWWVHERTVYNRSLGKSEIVAWDLRWYICYNTVQKPDKTSSGWQIAGQDSKVFKEKEAMDKYLQGRIAAYAHLFTEISPPIPKGEEGRFSVNGVLLPGYTVETTVDDLLDFLDEEDGKETAPQKAQDPARPPVPHRPKKHAPTR